MNQIARGRQELRQAAQLVAAQSSGEPATRFGPLPVRADQSVAGTARAGTGNQSSSPSTSDTSAVVAAAESPVSRGDIEAAINLIDSGKVDEAVRALEDILRKDPNNEAALVEMAMVNLLDLRQPGEAINYLQRVMEVNPSNRIVMSELVSLYEEEGRSEEGLAFLQEMQAASPEAGDIAYGIGQMLTLQGRDQEAIPHLEKAATNGDNKGRAYRDLADAYSRSGDSGRALTAFDESIKAQEMSLQEKKAQGLPATFAEDSDQLHKDG